MINSQERFWRDEIASSYLESNDEFDTELGVKAWGQMLKGINKSELSSILECGSNIGRNLKLLSVLIPDSEINIIELSPEALDIAKKRFKINEYFQGSIKDSEFESSFDLVFTSGVLIHVNPDDLLSSMEKIYNHSKKYILIAEYFNRTPVEIEYRGQRNKLFKRDFGKLFYENFNCNLLDVGFLWGHLYDSAGFDDLTYWLFEKID